MAIISSAQKHCSITVSSSIEAKAYIVIYIENNNFSELKLSIVQSLIKINFVVGRGFAFVESIALNRRVVGSTPALAAT